ncbi:MAG TPA: oligopeptide transporter, OPT family [Gemmatimonadaceae bacterium]|nr:oligopeptide transporter, OPT family [Gemmatimonadaceae bacterium]
MARPDPDTPYIPASTSLPEITIRAVVLGMILSVVLAGANAYLGLFAGITVSASIPAAVISMAILKMFRDSNILENNIVQTAASAGESLAAGVIFTIPALVILGTWTEFNYWETTLIAGLGGALGVLFTIPLRRALIVENPLRFPEGVATAEVLKVGESGGTGVKYLAWAGLIGALFKLGDTGVRLWGGVLETARYVGGTIAYFGTNLSPALVGVGYIVGLNIAILIFLGGALNWLVAIPIVAWTQGVPEGMEAVDAAGRLWSTQTRYLGVGAMVVGGLWALIRLRVSIAGGIRSGLAAYRAQRVQGQEAILRTERDTPMPWVGVGLVLVSVPLGAMFVYFTQSLWIGLLMAVIMIIAGFLFSAVAGYMAGLVGSSNNPISGVTIATILTAALLLLVLMGADNPLGPAAAIFIGATVACAAAISGDNMQDLKAGRIVGATPVKQQIMQVVGVAASAFVMAPVLKLLLHAYGIGVPTATHAQPLAAPQATLMAAVAGGVFRGGLPWAMVIAGMAVAVLVIMLDVWLEKRGSEFRTPVLAVAVGIYLPFELSVAIMLGGVVAWLVGRRRTAIQLAMPEATRGGFAEWTTTGDRHGLLFAAGLITGEALVGILLAIPIVVTGDRNALALFGVHEWVWPGVLLLLLVMFGLYRVALGDRQAIGPRA